jgi:hypothetical protein
VTLLVARALDTPQTTMADYFNVLHKKEKNAAAPAAQQKRKFVPSALRGSQVVWEA